MILGGDLNAMPDEAMFEAVRAAGFRPEESNELSVGTRQRVVDGKVAILENHIDYLLVRGLAGRPRRDLAEGRRRRLSAGPERLDARRPRDRHREGRAALSAPIVTASSG